MGNKLKQAHRFFIKESKTYIGEFDIKHILYYLIAYIKFMYYNLINK